ncbi:MAG: hypothetical protein HYZ74_00175, partial [Elusimicrobia bacterium]|nr:hypothetical protein [Elusimicrobiota bacterium]
MRKLVFAGLAVIALLPGPAAADNPADALQQAAADLESQTGLDIREIAKISDISDLIKTHALDADRITSVQMCEAAIRGMVEGMGAHCHYYTAEEFKAEKNGQLFGTGIVLDVQETAAQPRVHSSLELAVEGAWMAVTAVVGLCGGTSSSRRRGPWTPTCS